MSSLIQPLPRVYIQLWVFHLNLKPYQMGNKLQQLQIAQPRLFGKNKLISKEMFNSFESKDLKEKKQMKRTITWEETVPPRTWFAIGLSLKVFGLMAVTAILEHSLEGEESMAPARRSEKDRKLEQLGLEGTGLAITILSASLTSILWVTSGSTSQVLSISTCCD